MLASMLANLTEWWDSIQKSIADESACPHNPTTLKADDDIDQSQTELIHLTPFVCDAPDCPPNNGSLSNRSHFQIRDVSIDYCSGDGYYYLTGTTSGIFPEVSATEGRSFDCAATDIRDM